MSTLNSREDDISRNQALWGPSSGTRKNSIRDSVLLFLLEELNVSLFAKFSEPSVWSVCQIFVHIFDLWIVHVFFESPSYKYKVFLRTFKSLLVSTPKYTLDVPITYNTITWTDNLVSNVILINFIPPVFHKELHESLGKDLKWSQLLKVTSQSSMSMVGGFIGHDQEGFSESLKTKLKECLMANIIEVETRSWWSGTLFTKLQCLQSILLHYNHWTMYYWPLQLPNTWLCNYYCMTRSGIWQAVYFLFWLWHNFGSLGFW